MTPVSVVRGFDYGIIGMSGLVFLYCCIAAITVVPWRRSKRESHAIQSFNAYWHARALLLLTGGLWVLVQILRLESVWTPNSVILKQRSNITNWTQEGLLCRLYLTLSLGALQPLFLLLALMLCQGTLSRHKSRRRCSLPNLKAVTLAFIWTLPVLVLQSVVAWISTFFDGDRWEGQNNKFLHYFFAAFKFGSAYSCGELYANQCALCVFPAVADIVSVAFTALFLVALLPTTQRMIAAAINRRIQRRLRIFQNVTVSTLVAGEALRTCTLVSNPYHWTFQILWVLYWLTICLLVTTTTWLLAIQPVRSAKKAAKEHEAWLRDPQEMTNFDSSKIDPLLGNSSQARQDTALKPVKQGKEGQDPDSMPEGDVADSIVHKKVADKFSQV